MLFDTKHYSMEIYLELYRQLVGSAIVSIVNAVNVVIQYGILS